MNIERRTFTLDGIEVERRDDGSPSKIAGHAAIFDVLSENLGGFREKIAPGAFDDVLDDDVRGLFNHDPNYPLGRTAAGTLKLAVDSKGLRYEIDPPDTQYARDLAVSMERGDISQSSFAFTVEKDDFDEDEDGRIIRTIIKVKRLYDVSPVTFPAYPDTTVAVRAFEEYQKSKRKAPNRWKYTKRLAIVEMN